MSGAAEMVAYGNGGNDEEEGVDLYLSERGMMPDISEMRFDESVTRRSMGLLDQPSLEFIEEETILEEYEEEEYEEYLVSTDDDEEEVTDDEHNDSDSPPPQGAYPDSGEGSPPELSKFLRADSGPIPFNEPLYVSSDEEEIVEEEVEEAILASYPEVKLVTASKSIENSPLTSDMIFTTPSGDESDIQIEEKVVAAIHGSPLPSEVIDEATSDEESQVLDFPPCFDITDENEEEITQRLYGAMHPALDVWDQRLAELMAPRPATPPGMASSDTPKDNSSPTATICNPSEVMTTTTPSLSWAARKAVDMVYPQNYCVPPITNVEDVMKHVQDNRATQQKKTKYARRSIQALEKEEQEEKEESTTTIGNPSEARMTATSTLSWAARKAVDMVYPQNYCVPPITNVENVTKDVQDNKATQQGKTKNVRNSIGASEKEEQEEKEESSSDHDATVAANQNPNEAAVKTLYEEKREDTNHQEPVEDTDVSTSASTSSNASMSSSTAALSSQALFWAVQSSVDAIYPADKQSTPPIAFVEQEDSVDSLRKEMQQSNSPVVEEEGGVDSQCLRKEEQQSTPSIAFVENEDDVEDSLRKEMQLSTSPLVEEEDGVDSQCLRKHKLQSSPLIDDEEEEADSQFVKKELQIINPKIFARRLREYQQEKAKDPSRWQNSLRMPETDDISAPIRRPKLPVKDRKANKIHQDMPDHTTPPQSPGSPEYQAQEHHHQQQEPWEDPLNCDERDNEVDQFDDEPMTSPPGSPDTNIRRARKTPLMPTSIHTQGDEATDIQQGVEAWDDEEAQNNPPETKRFRFTPLTDEIYNTDPARYNPDYVVYERELMIVPERKRKEPMSAAEKKKKLISRLFCALLLVVPFSVGSYLALRKGV